MSGVENWREKLKGEGVRSLESQSGLEGVRFRGDSGSSGMMAAENQSSMKRSRFAVDCRLTVDDAFELVLSREGSHDPPLTSWMMWGIEELSDDVNTLDCDRLEARLSDV